MATLLAHEWLAPNGGSENVFEAMSDAFPSSTRYCLWNDAPDRFSTNVRETWLARTPLRRSKAAALPFLSSAWARVDLAGYDRVVTSSHAFAHHLATRAADVGIDAYAYVHTPARYVWTPEMDERGEGRIARAAAPLLRWHDRAHTSSRVSYAANSEFVRSRIADTWGREATVIYPPVAVERIQSVSDWAERVVDPAEQAILESLPSNFVLGASRLIEYKRLDLAMRVGDALGLPVVIAGAGPLEQVLRARAGEVSVPTQFLGRVSDELLYALYQRTDLFVFMAVEDFGIMPVEAMAAGAPVLVNEVGGAAESVLALRGGGTATFEAGTAELRLRALEACSRDEAATRERAPAFGEAAFRRRVLEWTGSTVGATT